jgi:transcription antitermination factor NusG
MSEIAGTGQLFVATTHWYAIQTRSRHEKRVAEQLQAKSIESFLPTHRCRKRWKNGVLADVQFPLFPGYLFARASLQQRLVLLQFPGVVGLAGSLTCPTPVPEDDIDTLRKIAGRLGAEPHPFLNVGDRVRIVAGPLAGLEGILTRRKQELRLILSVEIIMRSIAVEISEYDIEPVPTERRSMI